MQVFQILWKGLVRQDTLPNNKKKHGRNDSVLFLT